MRLAQARQRLHDLRRQVPARPEIGVKGRELGRGGQLPVWRDGLDAPRHEQQVLALGNGAVPRIEHGHVPHEQPRRLLRS